LKKCFELTSGQKVIFERIGDVTIEGIAQLEVKHYLGNLGDNGLSFWKSVYNWMQAGFDEKAYAALIILTTQKFSGHSKLNGWNDASTQLRLKILDDIHVAAEAREDKRQSKGPTKKIPESIKLQRWVLNSSRRIKLNSVIDKVVIDGNQPRLAQAYEQIKDIYCKGILDAKRNDFLDALMGFLISPKSVITNKWEVSYDDFKRKVGELTKIYCYETRTFPTKHILSNPTEPSLSSDRLFISKINEIEYSDAIPEAISHYMQASKTVLEEFREYEVSENRYTAFTKEVLDSFGPKYRSAKRNMKEVIKDSQDFFDATISTEPPIFQGFDSTPKSFRNGVIHMNMDDKEVNIKWRLE
jgi:hypothetical protein